jgi:hypothetical protein
MHFSHIFTRASLCIGLVLAAACSATAPSESSEASQSAILPDGVGSVITLESTRAAYGIASDGTNVYWIGQTSAGWSVNACAIGGCGGRPTVLASGPPLAEQDLVSLMTLAIDATDVYWTGPNAIMKCPKSGCDNDPTVLAAASVGDVLSLAIDANNVYWAVALPPAGQPAQPCGGGPYGGSCIWSGCSCNGAGAILECAKTGCGESPRILASNQFEPQAIVSDGTTVYWFASYSTGPLNAVPEPEYRPAVVECAAAGCNNNAALLVWVPDEQLSGMAVDATNLYFQGTSSGSYKCAKTGCNQTATVVGTGSGYYPIALGNGLAIDATSLYWAAPNYANPQSLVLYRCALWGCGSTPTVLWSSPLSTVGWPGGIAVDGRNVYWTTDLEATGTSPPTTTGDVFELPVCIPTTTCRSMSKTCGEWTDNCGNSLDCGTCEGDTACIEGRCIKVPPIKCTGLCQ